MNHTLFFNYNLFKMNKIINMYTLLTSLNLCILSLILFSKKSSATDDYRFQACQPRTCGNGLNIKFPFYINGQHKPYCGYPGFELNCNKYGDPIINLPENKFILKDIFYTNRSFRVLYNAVSGTSNTNGCLTQIRNTTFNSLSQIGFVNETSLHLLSNCTKPLSKDLLAYQVVCGDDNWELVIWDKDKNALQHGLQSCRTSVVATVELQQNEEKNGVGDYLGILRRGFMLEWYANDCTICEETGGRCGYSTTARNRQCFCPDGPQLPGCKPGSAAGKSRHKVIYISGCTAGTVVIFFIVVFAFRIRKSMLEWKGKTQINRDIEIFLKNHGSLAPRRYKYSDLKKMTDSFRDKLGEGGFSSVYRGKLPDGSHVAVKILKESKGNGEEFINEVASISRTSHVNIVAFLGFCFEGSKRALVYEFMTNGSLEKFIYNSSSLPEYQLGWEKLFQIAVGIARGIEYLHQGCKTRILHFDIKPHNILLDKDFKPKISDFGLAKLCPNRSSIVSMLGARGTIGYIAPEIVCRNIGDVSHKSDVYSYGMMVLEMAGQRKNAIAGIERSSEKYFPEWIYKNLEHNAELDLNSTMDADGSSRRRRMVIVGLWCIQTDPMSRPSMSRVIEMLEENVECLQIPPKPHLSSPPRVAEFPSTSEFTLSCDPK